MRLYQVFDAGKKELISIEVRLYVTIEENTIYPTAQQAITCLIVCQMLSNCYCDIHLFRFDDETGDVYILAGDDLQIIIPSHEPWRFVDEAEL